MLPMLAVIEPETVITIASPIIAAMGTAIVFLWRHGVRERKAWDSERERHRTEIAGIYEQVEELHKKLLAASESRRKEQDAAGERLADLTVAVGLILTRIQEKNNAD